MSEGLAQNGGSSSHIGEQNHMLRGGVALDTLKQILKDTMKYNDTEISSIESAESLISSH
jgi:hypothetical protein